MDLCNPVPSGIEPSAIQGFILTQDSKRAIGQSASCTRGEVTLSSQSVASVIALVRCRAHAEPATPERGASVYPSRPK